MENQRPQRRTPVLPPGRERKRDDEVSRWYLLIPVVGLTIMYGFPQYAWLLSDIASHLLGAALFLIIYLHDRAGFLWCLALGTRRWPSTPFVHTVTATRITERLGEHTRVIDFADVRRVHLVVAPLWDDVWSTAHFHGEDDRRLGTVYLSLHSWPKIREQLEARGIPVTIRRLRSWFFQLKQHNAELWATEQPHEPAGRGQRPR